MVTSLPPSTAHTSKCATEFLTVFFIFSHPPPTWDLGDRQTVGFESLMRGCRSLRGLRAFAPSPRQPPRQIIYIQASVAKTERWERVIVSTEGEEQSDLSWQESWDGPNMAVKLNKGLLSFRQVGGVFVLFDRTQGTVTATAAGGKASET